MQVKYVRLVAQFSIMTTECDTWHSPAQERGTEVIVVPVLFPTLKGECELQEDWISLIQKEKDAIGFERDACNLKVSRL